MIRLYTVIFVALASIVISAQDDRPDAEIINDEGGPVLITGRLTYTNPFFTDGVAEPLVILEDQAGFIDRNPYFVFPPESQTLGQFTSDFFSSPVSYSLSLPIEPQGSLRDVDNDDEEDTGVMVFAVAYWTNTWGDPFLEVRDLSGGGWSGAYASTRISPDPEQRMEVIGGKYLIYAPDKEQGFPSGFGEDGLLFTEDDPIVRVPQGYTVVDLNEDPFTFNRSARQIINLIEGEDAQLVDFSNLSYAEAFDAMVEKYSREYAFTKAKNIDWDALHTEFRPLFEKADEKDDPYIYLNALREVIWRIPDGHVNLSPFGPMAQDRNFDIARGIGMNIRTTDNGRVLVSYILEGGPADIAGIEVGAEVFEIDNMPIEDYISNVVSWEQPFSTDHNLRLSQERYAIRFDLNTSFVDIEFANPGDTKSTTTTLLTSEEFESLQEGSQITLTGFELPVEFRVLDNGYGYTAIYGFLDNQLLTIQLWERMIQSFNAAGVPGLIIDMRQNGGGFPFIADQMAAYFFDEELILGGRGTYSEETDDFFFDQRGQERFYLPPEQMRYRRPVAVLISENCASACERFVYDMSLEGRADIVGMYPTAGLGGGVNDFKMPLDVTVRITVTRSVNADGDIHIEGTGVVPTIRVPVNEETLFNDNDPILEYGIEALNAAIDVPTEDGGSIAIGDDVLGQFEIGKRLRYKLELPSNTTIDITLAGTDDGELTTVLRLYDMDGNLQITNEDTQLSKSGSSALVGLVSQQDITVIIEVSTFQDRFEGPFVLSVQESR